MTTKRVIQSFFPASTAFINATIIGNILLDKYVLVPNTVAELCPEVTITVGGSGGGGVHAANTTNTTLRQPILFLAACIGALIGIRGCRSLPRYWSVAFGAFAIMNVDALFLHCLCPSLGNIGTDTYPEGYPLLWMIDTYMTGVSSVGLLIASLERWTSRDQSRWFWILQAVGILCIVWFTVDHPPLSLPNDDIAAAAPSFPLELWYLIPLLLAGVPLNGIVFGGLFRNRRGASLRWTTGHVALCGGLCISVLGIGLDGFWCRTLGGRTGTTALLLADLLTPMTLTFLGCDLCFWGIHRWIFQQSTSEEYAKRHMD